MARRKVIVAVLQTAMITRKSRCRDAFKSDQRLSLILGASNKANRI
jgi:hypothetical protein